MSDLVSRLKSPEVFISIGGMTSLVAHEAADHIEAQAAEIARLRAEVAAARREGMEEAAQIADSCAADWRKSARATNIEYTKWKYEDRTDAGEEIVAAILAAAKEGKP